MAGELNKLATPVFLVVARFLRQVQRGQPVTGEALRSELVQLLHDLALQAEGQSALSGDWAIARRALIYLLDEVCCETNWEYRGWWAGRTLEAELLGHPQRMRGVYFYDDLQSVLQRADAARSGRSAEGARLVELLTVFYLSLRFGFAGKYAGQPQELERLVRELANRLPGVEQTQLRRLFPQAYEHTLEIPPHHEGPLRLVTLAAVMVGLVILLLGLRQMLGADLLAELTSAAETAGNAFSTSQP
ncbi:MAG: hypothetical protein HJJLKODD_00883 [Phycisphaerae bacterium]|nr:hypothetical protein [Phycisphaerae bacterium]